jgi:hypothetical protein
MVSGDGHEEERKTVSHRGSRGCFIRLGVPAILDRYSRDARQRHGDQLPFFAELRQVGRCFLRFASFALAHRQDVCHADDFFKGFELSFGLKGEQSWDF